MKANNVSTFKDLAIYFRKQQKKLWRTISAKKKVIYWANVDIDLPVDEDDVIQWWGESFTMNKLAGRKNPIILSTYDQTYLDIGFGDQDCESSRPYQNWTMAYSFEPKVTNVNVIGGTSCMWNEIGNLHTFDQKVIQKSSIIGERLWNSKMNIKTDIRNIAARLTAHSQRLRDRGFKVWPIASGFC
jgi:hexosaminidase